MRILDFQSVIQTHQLLLAGGCLVNCARYGARSQNREEHENIKAHLQGKISYVKSINPQRAKKLEQIFREIDW